ncbi:MAG: hypothetical protein ABIQ18_40885 [Umezawaea sp.]
MTATAPKAPTAPGVRSWWGVPFATAGRYRRPVVADFDPGRPYDRLTVPVAKVYHGLEQVRDAQADLESGTTPGKHVVVLDD